MKKLLGIVVLGLLWCNVGNAGIKEPGKDPTCFKLGTIQFNKQVKIYLNVRQNIVFYIGCKDYSFETHRRTGPNIKENHKEGYKNCRKKAKKRGIEDCYLFSINDVIVWGKDESYVNKISEETKKKEKDPEFINKRVKAGAKANFIDTKPVSISEIAGWSHSCDKEDFIKHVGTVDGCIGIKKLGKIDKSKKKLVVFMGGDYKGKKPNNNPKTYSGFSKIIKDQKDDINFFFLARPGHQFEGRSRSAGKFKNFEIQNKILERVQFKKGWEANKLISQTLYKLKEFYQAEQLIAIGFSGGSNDIGVINGKVPGLIDVAIMGGCDCYAGGGVSGQFWIPGHFIDTIDLKTKIVLITGEKDEYVWSADTYAKLAKKRGINAEAHVVKGGHDGKKTLLSYGKDIVKEAL